MAKGQPNGDDRKLNFVAKIRDESNEWKPVYIAPDATDKIRGDVYLSDAIDGTGPKEPSNIQCNAANGTTAATPVAVNQVYKKAIKNDITTNQTMQSSLSPLEDNTLSLGTAAKRWQNIYAENLNGNAATATKLQNDRTISIENGTNNEKKVNVTAKVSFNDNTNIQLKLDSIDASTIKYNKLPLEVIPHGALERLVHVANQKARFELTTATVQLGDTVQQDDTKVMYVVVDESNLNNAAGYTEYVAGTAAQAQRLTPGNTILTDLSSDESEIFNGESPVTPGVTGILPIKHGGTGTNSIEDAWKNLGGGEVGKLDFNNDENYYLNGKGQWSKISEFDYNHAGLVPSPNTEEVVTSPDSLKLLLDHGWKDLSDISTSSNFISDRLNKIEEDEEVWGYPYYTKIASDKTIEDLISQLLPRILPNPSSLTKNENNILVGYTDGTTEDLYTWTSIDKVVPPSNSVYIGTQEPEDPNVNVWITP